MSVKKNNFLNGNPPMADDNFLNGVKDEINNLISYFAEEDSSNREQQAYAVLTAVLGGLNMKLTPESTPTDYKAVFSSFKKTIFPRDFTFFDGMVLWLNNTIENAGPATITILDRGPYNILNSNGDPLDIGMLKTGLQKLVFSSALGTFYLGSSANIDLSNIDDNGKNVIKTVAETNNKANVDLSNINDDGKNVIKTVAETNNKANVDLSNINEAGKNVIKMYAGGAGGGARYDYSNPVEATETYIAPNDGLLYFRYNSNNELRFKIEIYINGTIVFNYNIAGSSHLLRIVSDLIPLTKGDVFTQSLGGVNPRNKHFMFFNVKNN